MSLFDNLGQNQQPTQQMNPMQMVQQLKQNPAQMLNQAHLNVPQNMMNNPQQIVNHLVQSGQVPQDRLNAAMQMAQRMGFNIPR
jgi:hypothetical protein